MPSQVQFFNVLTGTTLLCRTILQCPHVHKFKMSSQVQLCSQSTVTSIQFPHTYHSIVSSVVQFSYTMSLHVQLYNVLTGPLHFQVQYYIVLAKYNI